MTCGDKFNKNCPTGGSRVDPAETDGRPRCIFPGCGKPLRGDGNCVDGHPQGAAGAPGARREALEAALCVATDLARPGLLLPGARLERDEARAVLAADGSADALATAAQHILNTVASLQSFPSLNRGDRVRFRKEGVEGTGVILEIFGGGQYEIGAEHYDREAQQTQLWHPAAQRGILEQAVRCTAADILDCTSLADDSRVVAARMTLERTWAGPGSYEDTVEVAIPSFGGGSVVRPDGRGGETEHEFDISYLRVRVCGTEATLYAGDKYGDIVDFTLPRADLLAIMQQFNHDGINKLVLEGTGEAGLSSEDEPWDWTFDTAWIDVRGRRVDFGFSEAGEDQFAFHVPTRAFLDLCQTTLELHKP